MRLSALLISVTAGCALGAAPGPFKTKQEVIAYIPGMQNAGSAEQNAAVITYPTSGPTSTGFPLLVFGHGATVSGPGATGGGYSTLLATVASYGFVIVSPTSCAMCDFTHDMVTTAADCKKNTTLHPALATVDFSRTGFFGHSNGGCASQEIAGKTEYVQEYNIKAAVASHCGCPCQTGPCRKYDTAGSAVPFMYSSTSGDTVAPPAGSTNGYNLAGAGDKVLWMAEGGSHFEPSGMGKNREDKPIALFFACHVRGEHCDDVYGPSGDAICGTDGVEMHQCLVHRAGDPAGTPAPFNVPTPPPGPPPRTLPPGPPGPGPTPPGPPTPPVPPTPPAPVPAACIAELEKDCAGDKGKASACALCVVRNQNDLRTAGCHIVLGTHDDSYAWCQNGAN